MTALDLLDRTDLTHRGDWKANLAALGGDGFHSKAEWRMTGMSSNFDVFQVPKLNEKVILVRNDHDNSIICVDLIDEKRKLGVMTAQPPTKVNAIGPPPEPGALSIVPQDGPSFVVGAKIAD